MSLPVIVGLVLVLSSLFAVLGIGGASVYTPLFFWLGMPFSNAMVLGLFASVVSTGISSFNYRKLLNISEAAWLLVGVLVGAPAGVWISKNVPTQFLIGACAVLFLLGAFRLAYLRMLDINEEKEGGLASDNSALAVGGKIFAGILTGVISGMLGIGGGIFLAPLLISLNYSAKKAAVISTFVVFFSSFVSLAGHASDMDFNISVAIWVGVAAFVGAAFGSKKLAESRVNPIGMRTVFALLLVLFAIKLFYDFFLF